MNISQIVENELKNQTYTNVQRRVRKFPGMILNHMFNRQDLQLIDLLGEQYYIDTLIQDIAKINKCRPDSKRWEYAYDCTSKRPNAAYFNVFLENQDKDVLTKDCKQLNKLTMMPLEEACMNIYEQLNKINDTESLSEKYTVKNAKELKKLKESVDTVKIPAPWNKYLEVDNYTPEEGEYNVGDRIGEYTLVAYLAPNSAYEDKFDGWPMLFKDSSNNYVVGETSHDNVYAWDIDDYALNESSNGKQDVIHEAQRIHNELIKKGYTDEEIDSIIRILHTASINNFEPARPKLKAAFPDLDI